MRSSDSMTRGFSAETTRLGSNVEANISSLQPLQQDLRDFHPHPRLGLLGRGTHVGRADNARVADEPQVPGRLLGEDVEGGPADFARLKGLKERLLVYHAPARS